MVFKVLGYIQMCSLHTFNQFIRMEPLSVFRSFMH